MATIANVQKEYLYQLQDVGSILEQINASPTNDVRDRAILAAVAYYTRRIPRLQVALVSSIPAGAYPTPSDWLDISRIVFLEFPINLPTPSYYSSKGGWMIAPREDGFYIIPSPNPGSQFRLGYTAAHGVTAALPSEPIVGSIQAAHEALLGAIAVEHALREFAARYTGSVMANVDSVNYRSKYEEATKVADSIKALYERELSVAEMAFQRLADPDRYSKGWRT